MAIRKVTIYECDVCKKEVNSEVHLTKIRVPYLEDGEYYLDDCNSNDEDCIVDCCQECTEKIAKLLAEKIGFYDTDNEKLETR